MKKKKNNTVIYLKHISRTKQSSIGTILIIPRPSSTQNLKVKYVILRSKSTTFSILFHEEKQNKVKRFFKKTATQIKLYSMYFICFQRVGMQEWNKFLDIAAKIYDRFPHDFFHIFLDILCVFRIWSST